MVKGRLGRQAPAVLASPRRAPGVLTQAGTDPAPAHAIRALQVAHGKLKTQHEAMRDDLGAALDGWETVAGAADQTRIDALRKRWGIDAVSTAPDEQDLTDGIAER